MAFKDPNTQTAPASSTDSLDYRNIGAPSENAVAPAPQATDPLPTVNVVGHPPRAGRGQARDSHPYSEDVKKMQNALLTVASELNIRHGKDNPNPELTKKIQDISRHVEGQGTAYGDGRWGANTQEALNGLYGFISELTKHMSAEVKQKYETLLKQMESAGVGPGKQYNQINVRDVSPYAKTLYGSIRTIIDNWNDDIEKAMTASKNAPAQEPAAGAGEAVPAAGAAGAGGEATQTAQQPGAQPGGVVPAGYKPQQPGEGQTQQGQGAGAGVGLSVYPFDLDGDIISMQQFQQFLTQVFALQNVQEFRKTLGPYTEALNGQSSAATRSVDNWLQEARRNQSIDGFSLALGVNADELVEANFNHDFVTARNMLGMLSEICARLSYIIEMLRRTKMFDDVALREQAQRGTDYTRRIGVIVDKIESALKSGQHPGGQGRGQYGTPPPSQEGPPGPPPFNGAPPPPPGR
jgi:hypothetical protein